MQTVVNFYQKHFPKVELWLQNHEKVLLFILLGIFFASYVFAAYYKHLNLADGLFDLGLQEQTIWNTANGRWFASSPEVTNFLGDHFSPSLLLVAAVYKIFPATLTLFTLQVGAIALGIYAFYRIAKLKLKQFLPAFFVLSILLLYRPLAGLLLFDVHEIAFAFPFLVFGIWALEKKKIILGLVLLLIAMGFKEDVGMLVAMLGLYYGWIDKQKWGHALFGFCIVYVLTAVGILLPVFRNGIASDTLDRFAYLKDGPIAALAELLTVYKLKYLLLLFLPVLPILWAIPQLLLLVAPSLLGNLLSSSSYQTSAAAQYDVLITVAIFFALILGLAKLQKLEAKSWAFNLAVLTIMATVLLNILLLGQHLLPKALLGVVPRSADRVALEAIMQDIPREKILPFQII